MAQTSFRRFPGQWALQLGDRSISVVWLLALSGSLAGVFGLFPIEVGNNILRQFAVSRHND